MLVGSVKKVGFSGGVTMRLALAAFLFLMILLGIGAQESGAYEGWTALAPMSSARMAHQMVLLPNGKILIAGGRVDNATYVKPAGLCNIPTNVWTAGLDMGSMRDATDEPSKAEPSDYSTNTTVPIDNMATLHLGYSAPLLLSGKVPIAGSCNDGTTHLAGAEPYGAATGTFAATRGMTTRTDISAPFSRTGMRSSMCACVHDAFQRFVIGFRAKYGTTAMHCSSGLPMSIFPERRSCDVP